MTGAGPLEAGRAAFAAQAWTEARTHLLEADRASALAPDDLDALAVSAYMAGMDDAATDAWTRAYHGWVDAGQTRRAVRSAFWLAFAMIQRGEMAPASGWFGRAARMLEDDPDAPERGLLLVPQAVQRMFRGDAEGARPMFAQAAEIGAGAGDPDLTAFGRLGLGQALIMTGAPADGVALLDEAMVAVTAREVSPILAGLAYCIVIEACQDIFDVRRAREWTIALTRWCELQPDLVTYRGQCLVYRAEIMQLQGAWSDAADEAERACARLSEPPGHAAVGMAYYARAELHRLRGEFEEAEAAYRRANEHGRVPQPGLSLLRLGEGRTDAAAASVERALDAAEQHQVTRPRLLPALVEIRLAAGDVAAARAAADELEGVASASGAPFLRALSAHASGAVRLAEGDARGALGPLREAVAAWRELDVPYECARARVLVAEACRAIQDDEGSEMELDAARRTFEALGAQPDLVRLARLAPADGGPLTQREREVLALLATGRTNRMIATELVLSEKTVARHLSNIYTKLGVSSRAAATAYAYEHDLV